MPSKNPFGKKPGNEAGEKPVEELEQPSPAQEPTALVTEPAADDPVLVVSTYDAKNGGLVQTSFPGRTFRNTEWSVNVQVLAEYDGKLVINPNAIVAVDQR